MVATPRRLWPTGSQRRPAASTLRGWSGPRLPATRARPAAARPPARPARNVPA